MICNLWLTIYRFTDLRVAKEVGSDGSTAGGGRSDPSEWPRPRCSALPVADKAEHKCVPGSIADAAASSARKISGTPNGRQKQRSLAVGKAHTGHRNRRAAFASNGVLLIIISHPIRDG